MILEKIKLFPIISKSMKYIFSGKNVSYRNCICMDIENMCYICSYALALVEKAASAKPYFRISTSHLFEDLFYNCLLWLN